MAVTQYIGARYVPIFDGEWDNSKVYEPLTVVQYQGNSYTSKQAVPTGIEITNTQFWAETGNYNAQVEAYRREVLAFDDRITANTDAISGEILARADADDALQADINAEKLARSNGDLQEKNARIDADTALQNQINDLKEKNILVIGDSWSSDDAPSVSARGNAPAWTHRMPSYYNIYNFSAGGSGYIKTGNDGSNFQSQATAAAADTTFDNDDIDIVIVFGGVNDLNDSQTAASVASACQTMINTLKTNFTKAEIYGLVMNTNLKQWYREIQEYVYQLDNTYTSNGCNVQKTYTWGLAPSGTWWADPLHPNETGCKKLASYIRMMLEGGSGNNVSFASPSSITWSANGGAETALVPTTFNNDSYFNPFTGETVINMEIAANDLNITAGTQFLLKITIPGYYKMFNNCISVNTNYGAAVVSGWAGATDKSNENFTIGVNVTNLTESTFSDIRIFLSYNEVQ